MSDFLVIGGGIAGVSAAARLSHLGRVTLLEAENGLGYHASGRSAALYEESYGKPSTVALNKASREYLTRANGGVTSPRGLMIVGSRGHEEAFEKDMAEMSFSPISVEEALEMVPILDREVLTGAGFNAEARDIDTDLLIQNFAREVRANGGEVLTGQQVQKITREAGRWRVQTQKGEHSAEMLFNAAGAWADDIARMAGIEPLGFTPYRRSMARLPAPGGHDVSRWPMMFGPGETWYAKPDAGKLLVSPAEEEATHPHDAWADDMVIAEGLARYEEVVTEPVTRVETTWAGLRTFAPDRCLVIGPEPAEPSFFWVAGQGGYGFQTSPAASRLVADIVAGRPSELDEDTVAALSPARLR